MPFNPASDPLTLDSVLNGKDGKSWITREQIYYRHPNTGICVLVPVNFQFDLASFPALSKPFLNNDDARVRRAAAVHDWIFRKKGRMPSFYYQTVRHPSRLISLSDANNMFYTGLLEDRYPAWKAQMSYRGLQLGSWWSWYFE